MSRVQYLWKKKMINTLSQFGIAEGLLSIIERYFDGEIDEAYLHQITRIPVQSVSPTILIQLYEHYEHWKQVHDHTDYQRLLFVLTKLAGCEIVNWLAPDSLRLFQWTLENWLNERTIGLDYAGVIHQLYKRNPEWFIQYAQTVPDDLKWLLYTEMICRDPESYPHLVQELQEKLELHIRFFLEQYGYSDSVIDPIIPVILDGDLSDLQKLFRQQPLKSNGFLIEQKINPFLIAAYRLSSTGSFYRNLFYIHLIADENRSVEQIVYFIDRHFADKYRRDEHLQNLRTTLYQVGFGLTWVRWLLRQIQQGETTFQSNLSFEFLDQPNVYHNAMISSYGLDYVLLYLHCADSSHSAKSLHKLERSFSDELLHVFSRKLGERRQTYVYAFLAGRWPLDLLMDRLRQQLPANIGIPFPFDSYLWLKALIPQYDRAIQLLWMGEDFKSLIPVCELFIQQFGFQAWTDWLDTLQVSHAQQLSLCLQASFGTDAPNLVAASAAWVEVQWRNHSDLITSNWSAYSVKARVHLISQWMEYDRERMAPMLDQLTRDRSKRVQKLIVTSLPNDYAEWTPHQTAQTVTTLVESSEPEVITVQVDAPIDQNMQVENKVFSEDIITRRTGERGRPKKIMLDWVPWQTMPPIFDNTNNKQAVSVDQIREWVIIYAKNGSIQTHSAADRIVATWNDVSVAEWVWSLFMLWIQDGSETKKKWVMAMAVLHGDQRVIQVLLEKLDEWPRHARGTIAIEAMRAMVMTNRDSIMVQLATVAHQSKIRQVRESARTVLEEFAVLNGFDQEEFQDRLIPDHGFSFARERMFDFGSRMFRVKMNDDLQFEIYDAWNKSYKSLPYPSKQDDGDRSQQSWEEMKLLRKQLPLTVSKQQQRFMDVMVFPRYWTFEEWKNRFALHPIMHSFSVGLLWGWYLNGVLQAPFRYPINEHNISWPENVRIGLVHPIELSNEQLTYWQANLIVNEPCQPIQQLNRSLSFADSKQADVDRFRGYEVKGTILKTHLETRGWLMGSLQERGQIFTFFRENEHNGIGAQLSFSGMPLAETHQTVVLESIKFYRAGTVQRGHYFTDDIAAEHELLRQDLPLRTWYELISDVATVL